MNLAGYAPAHASRGSAAMAAARARRPPSPSDRSGARGRRSASRFRSLRRSGRLHGPSREKPRWLAAVSPRSCMFRRWVISICHCRIPPRSPRSAAASARQTLRSGNDAGDHAIPAHHRAQRRGHQPRIRSARATSTPLMLLPARNSAWRWSCAAARQSPRRTPRRNAAR